MAVAFKEWACVCHALASGQQSLILRKGGIAEGRDGFAFREQEFFLFPTYYHGQLASLRLPPDTEMPSSASPGWINILLRAHVVEAGVMTDFEAVRRLQPFHIWKEAVLEQRFDFGGVAALHYAVVRVERLDPVWRFEEIPAYGGCRSWVQLPDPPPGTKYIPVLDNAEFGLRSEAILRAIR